MTSRHQGYDCLRASSPFRSFHCFGEAELSGSSDAEAQDALGDTRSKHPILLDDLSHFILKTSSMVFCGQAV
jgi:hypothetical protein